MEMKNKNIFDVLVPQKCLIFKIRSEAQQDDQLPPAYFAPTNFCKEGF